MTGLEFIMSIVGAGFGGYASFFLLWPILAPFGIDVLGYGVIYLGMPAGSLVGIALVGKVVRGSHQCNCRAIVFAIVTCDLAILIGRYLENALENAFFLDAGYLILIAGGFSFLGYKASRLGTTRWKRGEGN